MKARLPAEDLGQHCHAGAQRLLHSSRCCDAGDVAGGPERGGTETDAAVWGLCVWEAPGQKNGLSTLTPRQKWRGSWVWHLPCLLSECRSSMGHTCNGKGAAGASYPSPVLRCEQINASVLHPEVSSWHCNGAPWFMCQEWDPSVSVIQGQWWQAIFQFFKNSTEVQLCSPPYDFIPSSPSRLQSVAPPSHGDFLADLHFFLPWAIHSTGRQVGVGACLVTRGPISIPSSGHDF